jgi:hypothetical protein
MSKHTSGIIENNETFKRLLFQKVQALYFPDTLKRSGGHLIKSGMPQCLYATPLIPAKPKENNKVL